LRITKRLDWTLLKRAPHEVSVLEDDLEGPKPDYMSARDSERHPDFNGWFSARDIARRLQEACSASEQATLPFSTGEKVKTCANFEPHGT
jgi:hypothetical protein